MQQVSGSKAGVWLPLPIHDDEGFSSGPSFILSGCCLRSIGCHLTVEHQFLDFVTEKSSARDSPAAPCPQDGRVLATSAM
jgi:hypothetical protein